MSKNQEQFGHYLIVDSIDESINSHVSLAVKPDYHQYVALKRLSDRRVSHDGFREIFATEGWISSHLDHPNIPKIVERGFDSSDVPFMSFEYVSGISLQKAINSLKKIDKTIPLSLTLYIFRELATTLHYVHTLHEIHQGLPVGAASNTVHPEHIVHCDLNPKNVILGFDGSVNLIDFGIASTSLTRKPPESLNGTFNFMSPEQVKGLVVDNRSDIFSLCEMMYYSLAGLPPFDADTDLAIVERLRTGTFTPLERVNSQIPATLGRIVHRGLQPAPDQRYESMHTLGDEIENFRSISRINYTTKHFSRWLTGTFSSTYNEEQKKISELPTMLVECEHMSIKSPMRLNLVENAISKTAIFNPEKKQTLHGLGKPQGIAQPAKKSSDTSPYSAKATVQRSPESNPTVAEKNVHEKGQKKQHSADHTKVDDSKSENPGEMWDDGPTLLDDQQDVHLRRIIDSRQPSPKKKSDEVTTVGVPVTEFDPTGDITEQDSPHRNRVSKKSATLESQDLKSNLKDYAAQRKVANQKNQQSVASGPRKKGKQLGMMSFMWRSALFALLFSSAFVILLFFLFIRPVLNDRNTITPVTQESSVSPEKKPDAPSAVTTDTANSTTLKQDIKTPAAPPQAAKHSAEAMIEKSTAGTVPHVDEQATHESDTLKQHSQRQKAEAHKRIEDTSHDRTSHHRTTRQKRLTKAALQRRLQRSKRQQSIKEQKDASISTESNVAVGYLTIQSAPAAELILVDGRSTGRGTPIGSSAPLRLSAGKHRVTFVSGGHNYSFQVIIKDGEQTKLSRVLPVP